ncbi:prepilin peptidase [Zavarzinella formosa]|uniref:prepilin peptidase n=1 Tax=Zavarzinella formosa TaxID=360055 RepID=UPI0002EDCBAD|nr:A24 family peptidase [Zavarzinella formosa]
MDSITLAEIVWVLTAFVFGAAWGSFINVVAGRLPLEKSVLWPNSHCLSCLNSLYFIDNLPIFGWLYRRGRCRFCGAKFSSRYLWVEVLSGVIFAVLFYLEIMLNWQKVPMLSETSHQRFIQEMPWEGIFFFIQHAILASFLLAATISDFDHHSIPLSLTTTGTVIGLASAVLFPWPWPSNPVVANGLPPNLPWAFNVPPGGIPSGLYVWPVWGPLPSWLPAGSPQLGLVTGLVGAMTGMLMVRSVKFLFEKGLGKESIGFGDADLMMMAGAFTGWQIVAVGFFVGSILSLPLGVIFKFYRKQEYLPFGPGLALGVMVTLLGWPWMRLVLQQTLFDDFQILLMVVLLGGGMFFASMFLRLMGRGK